MGALGTDGGNWEEQELNDDDRQARCWRRRPDGFAVKEEERIIYVLEFKRVSDAGEGSSGPMPSTSALQSQHFVLTGQPKYMLRGNLKSIIIDYTGEVRDTISQKNRFLVKGVDGGPRKVRKAEELGISAIDEDVLFDLICGETSQSEGTCSSSDRRAGVGGKGPAPKKSIKKSAPKKYALEKASPT